MKEQFRSIKFQKKNLILLEKIKEILGEYDEKGIKVTLRQLYYQLVSRDIIENKISEYSKLSSLLTNARYTGDIDWDAIEDRVRIPDIPNIYDDIDQLMRAAIQSYKKDRWKEQDCYVELWSEKDALSSVISPITKKYQIPFCVNRGYTSASAMYESFRRVIHERAIKNMQTNKIIILYLGDHDPSGLDMIRDINDRMKEFIEKNHDIEFIIVPIGLTMEQIKLYSPPSNPAKTKDPRATGYIEEFGKVSWEVDALRPEVLQELIKTNILKYLDLEKFEQVQKQEAEEIQQIKNLAEKIKSGGEE